MSENSSPPKDPVKAKWVPTEFDPGRKRRRALLLGYSGKGFSGLQFQKQPEVKTIENTLHQALVSIGGISASNAETTQKVKWSRASRTDKGVSAAMQVISLNLVLRKTEEVGTLNEQGTGWNEKKFVNRLNEVLPNGIRAFGCYRTLSSFSAYHACGGRAYEYLLPLGPLKTNRPDLELDAFIRSIEPYMQLYVGTRSYHNFASSSESAGALRFIKSITLLPEIVVLNDDQKAPMVKIRIVGQSFMMYQIRKMIGVAVACWSHDADVSAAETKDAETKDAETEAAETEATETKAVETKAAETEAAETEAVETETKASSTLGMDTMNLLFTKDKWFSTPTAPAEGLLLDELYFSGYEAKITSLDADRQVLGPELEREEREVFKQNVVYPDMFTTDEDVQVFREFAAHVAHPDQALPWPERAPEVSMRQAKKRKLARDNKKNHAKRFHVDRTTENKLRKETLKNDETTTTEETSA